MTPTKNLLARVRLRRRLVALADDVQTGLAAGASAALLVIVLRRFAAPSIDPAWAAIAGGAAVAGIAVAGVIRRRMTDAELAAAADAGLGLRERISTALWCRTADEPLGALVADDAEAAAARVRPADLRSAFRPELRRRPLAVAAAALAVTALVAVWQPGAEAVESPERRAVRLADENRIAEVARKVRDAARRVEETAGERREAHLQIAAAEVLRRSDDMMRDPPAREAALEQWSALAEGVREQARKRIGMREPSSAPEAAQQDRALADLLKDLSAAGLESLQKDLSALEKRLRAPSESADDAEDAARPTADDVRALAERVDAMRRALQRAEQDLDGAGDLGKKLRSIGNEDLLERIAERLRDVASKMEDDRYEGLQAEQDDEELDLDAMSREELEELLKELEELAALEEMKEMMQGAAGETRGGRRLRLGGSRGT